MAVAANGSTALVGAPQDENPNGEEAGATYVFKRSGGSWRQQANPATDNGDSHDTFDLSVVVSSTGQSTAPEEGWLRLPTRQGWRPASREVATGGGRP